MANLLTPPTIDLTILFDPNPSEASKKELLASLSEACREWGFFQIINHGIKTNPSNSLLRFLGVPGQDIDEFWDSMVSFFALPPENKKALSRSKTNSRGYFDTELTKQKVDWKEGTTGEGLRGLT